MRRFAIPVGAIALAIALLPVQAQGLTSPRPKIAVIVLENTERSAIVGKNVAPFMNAMIAQGKQFANDHGFKNSSHDYRAMIAGEQVASTPVSNNVFHQFDAQGVRWVNLEESMGANCGVDPIPSVVPGTDVPLYQHTHDPAYAYRANSSCKANDRPLTSDDQLRSLPSFSYIVPNNCDNAHTFPSGGNCPAYFGTNHGSKQINLADKWVAHVVGVITAADPSVIVFVTFDESTDSTHQLLYAAEVGPGITGGTKDGQHYDHYSFCAGIWEEFGLAGAAPNNAATATPLPL